MRYPPSENATFRDDDVLVAAAGTGSIHFGVWGVCGLYISVRCGFVTVHMLLLNVFSNFTVCCHTHPRRLLSKLPNYRTPLFLPINVVHSRQPSPFLNQRNQLHRNIRYILTLHPRLKRYSVQVRPVLSLGYLS